MIKRHVKKNQANPNGAIRNQRTLVNVPHTVGFTVGAGARLSQFVLNLSVKRLTAPDVTPGPAPAAKGKA
jgi:hypothetical protein